MISNGTFLLNGHKFSITKNLTLNQLLDYLGYRNFLFIVECNGVVCHRKEWDKEIKPNDIIEIISIVGGG